MTTWIVHQTRRRDGRPHIDVQVDGPVRHIYPHDTRLFLNGTAALAYAREVLADAQDGDRIVPLGSGTLIAISCLVLAEYVDRFQILHWVRDLQSHLPVEIDLTDDELLRGADECSTD